MKQVFTTRITQLLGIDHPVVCGGMTTVGRAELAAAVSNAGALGMVTALTTGSPENLALEIAKTRELTDRPFGINLTILPTINPVPFDEYADVIASSGVAAVETAGRNPEQYIAKFKEGGLVCIHKAVSVRHALTAQRIGVDIVSIDGFECAGHPGEDDVSNMVLVPAASRQLDIPVLASGGFGNGQGLVAALALGAEGINMGTRFVATREAPVHNNIKQAYVDSSERDTRLLYRPLRNTARFLKNEVTEAVLQIQQDKGQDLQFEDVRELVAGPRQREAWLEGNKDRGVITTGMVVGLIDDIPSCSELVERIVTEAADIVEQGLPSKLAG
ncbi:nitronate monooxygenase [Porticoccaceae bacterium]|nr:nitronate monooxygenase [Porticoccaceae bacterium]MDG2116350.1 nitronate monooxygenase [Porticoccaceae bacterium]